MHGRIVNDPRLDDLIETFDLLGDWEERYAHIIALGRDLPPLAEAEHTEANRVLGCASRVWLVIEGTTDRLHLRGDSDAALVKGLVAVVFHLVNDRPAGEIARYDLGQALQRLGLADHLSSQRVNGLAAMATRIQATARAMMAQGQTP